MFVIYTYYSSEANFVISSGLYEDRDLVGASARNQLACFSIISASGTDISSLRCNDSFVIKQI